MRAAVVLILLASFAGCSRETAPVPPPVTGGDRDAHGCIGSAGYSWCDQENDCVRPWELAEQRGFDNTESNFKDYCNHGVVPHANEAAGKADRLPGSEKPAESSSADSEATLWREDSRVLACAPSSLKPGDELTLTLGPKHGDGLAVRNETTGVWYFLVIRPPPADTESLMTPAQFAAASRVVIPASAKGHAWVVNRGNEPIFTISGTYKVFVSENMESDGGGYSCTVRYAASCAWDPRSVSPDSKAQQPESFMDIGSDMPVSAIVAKMGPAARDVGSGLHILEWDLTDGRVFSVSTPDFCSKPHRAGFREHNPGLGRQ